MIAPIPDDVTEAQMQQIKESIRKLRATVSTPQEIRDAFSTLLLLPTVLSNDVVLASLGTSRQELLELSKQHARVFREALKKFIGEVTTLSRH